MSATRLPLCKRSLHEEPDTNATARIRDAGTLQAALEHASVPVERVMLPTLSRPMLRPAVIEERPGTTYSGGGRPNTPARRCVRPSAR
jgi:hypothetical protein